MHRPVSKQWADLRRTLEAELGLEGSAHWLAFAAKQQAARARKLAEAEIDLPATGDDEARP